MIEVNWVNNLEYLMQKVLLEKIVKIWENWNFKNLGHIKFKTLIVTFYKLIN